ncbi:MAG TPA: hemolysin family protein [Vicinamibacterales bacterium]|nr:hemolysin family protein [Vicinamibacterales bacterium]
MTVILITVALLVVNALFVSAEFAVVGAPRPALEHKSKQGDRFARRLLGLLRAPIKQDQFIATAQLGVTLASLGLGMYGEHTLAGWLEPRLALSGVERVVAAHTLASILAITALTYVHILFGEMLPKALAIVHAERTLRAIFWPMRLVNLVCYPLVYVLNATGNAGLRLVGVRHQPGESDQVYTPEELQILVEESTEGGAIRAESGKLLRELLEFGDRTAGEAMVPRVRVLGIPAGAGPSDIRATLMKHHHTRYPIYDGDLDHIVGMLHVKDLLRRLLANESVGAGDLRPMPVVPVSAPLDAVLETMQRSSAHLAVVIDEHGGTAGVISLEDLFEEVVGEIDEGPSVPSIAVRPDGSVLAAGTVRLDELGRHFNLDLGHDEVDSVSGLVLAVLGRTPVVGDVVEYRRVRAEVTSTSGRGVKQARISLLPAGEGE